MKVFVRRAGFWNAKSFQISSQFGHIMLYGDSSFYSFNQSEFLDDPQYGCVQIISIDSFFGAYNRQVWNVIDLKLNDNERQKITSYFLEIAKNHVYSLKNNCTLECQRALETVGFVFS